MPQTRAQRTTASCLKPQSSSEFHDISSQLLASKEDVSLAGLISKQLVVIRKALDLNYELAQRATTREYRDVRGSSDDMQDLANLEGPIPPVSSSRWCVPPSPCAPQLCIPTSSIPTSGRSSRHVDIRDTVDRSSSTSSKAEIPRLLRGSQTSCRHSTLFPNTEIEASIEESLNATMDDVQKYYKDMGCWQAVARNETFNNFILGCIVLNTVWLAFDTDYNKADVLCNAPLICQIVDNLFTAIFFVEISIRFMAFQSKVEAFQDPAFLFDFLLVGLMVWENWMEVAIYLLAGSSDTLRSPGASFMRIFRVFRLARVARTARLFKSMPQMFILLKAMTVAVKSVGSILVMPTLIIYIFALIFTQLLAETPVGAAGVIYYVLFLIFLFLSSLTLMNMLIGILCDVVSNASDSENAILFEQDLAGIIEYAATTDTDGSNSIDKDEFLAMINTPELVQHLDDLGVDVVGIANMADFVFSQKLELSYLEFAQFISRFRGGQTAKVQDAMELQKFLTHRLSLFQDVVTNQIECIELQISQLIQPQGPQPNGISFSFQK